MKKIAALLVSTLVLLALGGLSAGLLSSRSQLDARKDDIAELRADMRKIRSDVAAAKKDAADANLRALLAEGDAGRQSLTDSQDSEDRISELEALVGHGSNLTGARGCIRQILTHLQDPRLYGVPTCNGYML